MKQPVKTSRRNASLAAAVIATPLIALALIGAADRDSLRAAADADLADEVAVQCADEANGRLDALAEGESTDVPSPVWDDLVAQCATVLDEGAAADEAPGLVLARLGAA